MPRGWTVSGLYSHKSSAQNGAAWWRRQGYLVRVRKASGGWVHYRRKK